MEWYIELIQLCWSQVTMTMKKQLFMWECCCNNGRAFEPFIRGMIDHFNLRNGYCDNVWARTRSYNMAKYSRYIFNWIDILVMYELDVVPIRWQEILNILFMFTKNYLCLPKIIFIIHIPHQNVFYIEECASFQNLWLME